MGCWAVFVTLQLLLSRYSRCSWTYSTIYAVQAALCLVTECFFVRLVSAYPTVNIHPPM